MGGKRKRHAIIKWKVLMTTTMIQSIIGGVVESYGALYVPMVDKVFKNDDNKHVKGALIGSLASGFLYGFSPLSSWMADKLGAQMVAVCGGIIVFLATFAASFARKFYSMALTYGVLLGIGCSFLFITNNIILSQHFGEDSTLAFGLLGFGNGVMNSVMPHIMTYCVDRLTLFGAIRTISLVLSLIMFLPFFWKEVDLEEEKEENDSKIIDKSIQTKIFQRISHPDLLKNPSKNSNKSNLYGNNHQNEKYFSYYDTRDEDFFDYGMVIVKNLKFTNQSNINEKLIEDENELSTTYSIVDSSDELSTHDSKSEINWSKIFEAFQNRGFLNLCVAMFIASLGYQVPNVHMINYSKELNLPGNPQILLTCLGASSAVGPLINPLIIDKFEEHISKFRIFQIFVLIYGVSVTFLALVNHFLILMILCLLIGYADGSLSTVIAPLIIDLVGTERSGNCIGIYYGSISVSITIAAPLAGYIYSTNNSYPAAFYTAGCLFIFGGLMLSLTHKNFKKQDAFDKWKVLMTTTLIQSVIGGVVESYGAFFVPMMTNVFKNDPLRPTKAGSLASGFQLGFSPVSSTLTQTTGPLIVAVFGGIIVFLATFSASFAREFFTMALAYGVCLGIGCSLLFISNNIIISQHFGEDSTLAFGLLGFGNGVMNSVMPHIMAYAVDKITLFGAIRTISLILSPMMFLPFYWKEIPIEYDKERSGYRILSDRIESQSMLFEKVSEDTINVKLKIPSKQSHKS